MFSTSLASDLTYTIDIFTFAFHQRPPNKAIKTRTPPEARMFRLNIGLTLRQPITYFIFAGILCLLPGLLFWNAESLPSARHLFKPPPPPLSRHGPGSTTGSGSHIGEPDNQALRAWKKPDGLKVIGLVFYGRKEFVEILDCYLKVGII